MDQMPIMAKKAKSKLKYSKRQVLLLMTLFNHCLRQPSCLNLFLV